MKILNFFEILEIWKKLLNFKFFFYLLILEFCNFMKILKFYEIFERVVSLLGHAMGCFPFGLIFTKH